MRTAIGQINTTVGDFEKNTELVLEKIQKAKELEAELIVFPELSICGYPPMDLLDHDAFVTGSLSALRRVQREAPSGIAVVVGYVDRNRESGGKALRNAAALLSDGQVLHVQNKTLLPTYDVFDETRYFEPASERTVFEFGGRRIGIAVCEDLWWEQEVEPGLRYPVDPVRDLLDLGADLILAPSASPYYRGKHQLRYSLLSRIGKRSGAEVVYVNMVGGNDSLIFDGRSMATDAQGRLIHLGRAFEEELAVIELAGTDGKRGDGRSGVSTGSPAGERRWAESRWPEPPEEGWDMVEAALVLGLRDYLKKCGFSRVHLGLSGGIDSALVAVLAARAVGPQNVAAFSLPSRYSSEGSKSDARLLAENLGLDYHVMPIEESFQGMMATLEPWFKDTEPGLAEENLQARIRGNLLMAWSNKFFSLLLETGNKSELATGYCTLYGDMAGGLAVIGDLFKTEVYALCRFINRDEELIPESILEKPPSAELRPDQKDEDSLPSYDLLDRILELYLLENKTRSQIVEAGYDGELVGEIIALVGRSEYKRRQAPPVLKISPRAFGTGRRMPIARKLYEC
ncbi:MAG: NAD+ synthase [Spirochaetales bacterium]|nr:NAD+ synthase [Spirochaetales bacterium]MCF7938619.1 NAD+ synthase [Spirochaetales bacterium]